jgi:hypothetical protein
MMLIKNLGCHSEASDRDLVIGYRSLQNLNEAHEKFRG